MGLTRLRAALGSALFAGGCAVLAALSSTTLMPWDEAVLAPATAGTARMTAPAPAPSPSAPVPPSFSKARRDALTRALDRYLDGRDGRLSVSVREPSSGLGYTYGPGVRTATASIVKVDIVVALLLQARARHRDLTANERRLAERAITVSDNDAATELWRAIGGAHGLAAANRRLGLHDTHPGLGEAWGSTRTSAADQVRLLGALTRRDGPLDAAARRYVLGLMGDVTAEQAWGVSAAAGRDASVALKNGWLPREAQGGRWTVNSIGLVRDGHGRSFLVAVISERHPTMAAGVAAVEHASEAVVDALSGAAERDGDRGGDGPGGQR
ncbi:MULTISPECIES: serine hydrolase [Actinomadura]|uniref:Serine hydrolase n=1 Tax=Actinomadura yumaensis TaxID=111807 RepID=A0ABW2CNE7_9ACTN|nr:serine hydrolase [Actinomadura sp. J1-007]MWK36661.1 hypothetical protein [Actinomadura sp. J1-007]